MKSPRKSNIQIKLSPTLEEKEEIEELFKRLKISKQRKSEIFSKLIIDGLKNLQGKYNPDTQTKTQKQSMQQKRKNLIDEIVSSINEKEYILFETIYNLFSKSSIFQSLGIRSQSDWFNKILDNENVRCIRLNEEYILIGKNSKLVKKLPDCHFPINNLYLATNRNMTKLQLKKNIIEKCLKNIKNSLKIKKDRVQELVIDALWKELINSDEGTEFDQNAKLVVRLRLNGEDEEALEILQKEKELETQKGGFDIIKSLTGGNYNIN